MAKAKKIDLTDEGDAEIKFDASFDLGIKVSTAFLHQALSGPGIPAERSITQQKLPNGEFRWTPLGLLIKYSNKGKLNRIGVPAANVSNWFL